MKSYSKIIFSLIMTSHVVFAIPPGTQTGDIQLINKLNEPISYTYTTIINNSESTGFGQIPAGQTVNAFPPTRIGGKSLWGNSINFTFTQPSTGKKADVELPLAGIPIQIGPDFFK